MDKHIDELFDTSRRSLMKKGALASSALALGLGSGTTAGASSSIQQNQPSQALMFSFDYHPGRTLQVIAALQQSITRQILGQQVGGDGNEIVSDTSDWSTVLGQYQVGGDGSGEYVLVFVRGGNLQQGDQLQVSTPASFFSEAVNLLEVSVSAGGGGGGGGNGGGGNGGDGDGGGGDGGDGDGGGGDGGGGDGGGGDGGGGNGGGGNGGGGG